jgi:hypothetical protein
VKAVPPLPETQQHPLAFETRLRHLQALVEQPVWPIRFARLNAFTP